MNDFLRESWGKLAADTEQIEVSEKDPLVEVYLKIKHVVDHLPESISLDQQDGLKALFEIMYDTLMRYNESILAYNTYKRLGDDRRDKENLQSKDEARRHTHNALIENLNALVRNFKKYNLDTTWKDVIGLKDRRRVQEWAQEVALYIAKKHE